MGADPEKKARRDVLKNLAAAGLGAAIAGPAVARGFLPLAGLQPPRPGTDEPIRPPVRPDAVFDVRDQGARGDGIADDRQAIIDTIHRVPESGGIVYLPRGVYRVSSRVAAPRSHVWLLGSGVDATTIRLADGANTSVLGVGPIGWKITDLTVDGNKAGQTGGTPNGISIDGDGSTETVHDVTIRDVRVVHTKAAGIRSCPGDGPTRARRVRIEDCMVEETAMEGIFLARADASTVANCLVSRTGGHGIIAKAGDGNAIAGNRVSHAGFNKATRFAHGIAMDGDGGAAPNRDHRLVNNRVTDSYDCGIEVADSVDDVLIEGNAVDGSGVGAAPVGTAGIYFGGGLTRSSRAMIRGNSVTRAKSAGIRVDSPGPGSRTDGVQIEGNVCRENEADGICLRWINGFNLTGNLCMNNDQAQRGGSGIRLIDVRDGTVVGNRAFDDQTPTKTQDYGLEVEGIARNVVVALNDFEGNEFGPIRGLGRSAGTSSLSEIPGVGSLGIVPIFVGSSPFTFAKRDLAREALHHREGERLGRLEGPFDDLRDLARDPLARARRGDPDLHDSLDDAV